MIPGRRRRQERRKAELFYVFLIRAAARYTRIPTQISRISDSYNAYDTRAYI